MINFEYIRVNTVEAAVAAWQKNPGSAYIAGGTNLVDLMKKAVTAPTRLIDITPLPLRDIVADNQWLKVGALVPNSDLAAHATMQEKFPLLAQALLAGASPQLRNMATVGGNLLQRTRCSYFYDTNMPCNKRQSGSGCGALEGINRMHAVFGASDTCVAVHPSDMCVALAAMDARIEVRSPKGTRQIAISDFHRLPGNDASRDNTLQPGELITSIQIPLPAPDSRVYYLKVRDRLSYAFALVSAAVSLVVSNNKIKDVRIAMGGVAHKPWRLPAVEQFLKGKEASPEIFRTAAQLAASGARPLKHNAFKTKLITATVEEALQQAMRG